MSRTASTSGLESNVAGRLEFEQVYDEHFDFVWRSVRRLGVSDAWAEDVTQEVFIVVQRQLASFEGRSSVKTWLFSIARNVVRDHRRSKHQRAAAVAIDVETAAWLASESSPLTDAIRAQAEDLVLAILEELDDTKRETFVLAEIEGLTAPEIAEATGANLATVYTRIRAARKAFEEAVVRMRAREERGSR